MTTPLLADFPELAHLLREDLEDLLTDPQYLQAVFHSLDRVKTLYQAHAELGMANESIANNNLRLQDSLYQLRSETQEAFNEAKSLEARWKEIEKEQKEVYQVQSSFQFFLIFPELISTLPHYQRFSPQFLLMRLKHSTIAQDDASEALASSFINEQMQSGISTPNGGAGVDEFIKEFKELRKVYHKRAMWGERWSDGKIAWRSD
ncbi:hypothetical protein J132_08806 [Termitomyces sp. J132]|nr:hypothetical protein J132_08806 [Termitomyces sp. J132]